METRELMYFLALAEELHFGRAAERLGIAQPPLSRAIQRLERRLGTPLFDRRARTLTGAGEVLAQEAARALEAVAAAERRTRRAAHSRRAVVVAMKPGGDGGLMGAILDALPAELEVEVLLCAVEERARLVRDGTADLAFLHVPYADLSGFDVEPLVEESAVVVLSRNHRLADRLAVGVHDLDGEPHARWPSQSGGQGPVVQDAAQLMQLIALGKAVAVVPESVRTQLRTDVTAVPVTDAPPTRVVLAWPESSRSPEVAAFVRTAASVAEICRAATAPSRSMPQASLGCP